MENLLLWTRYGALKSIYRKKGKRNSLDIGNMLYVTLTKNGYEAYSKEKHFARNAK